MAVSPAKAAKPAPTSSSMVAATRPTAKAPLTGRAGATRVMVVHSTIIAMPAASQNSANAQPPTIGRHERNRHQHDCRQDALFQFGRGGSLRQDRLSSGHAQPALALRPPKRRSRRQYSSMAARNVGVVEIGPEFRNEDEFRIGRLPGEEIRHPLLTRSADDEVRIRDAVGVEMPLDEFDVDARRIERAGLGHARQLPAWRRRFPGARRN